MSEDKLKRMRDTHRTLLNNLLEKIDEYLVDKDNVKQPDIELFLEQLSERSKTLKEKNEAVQEVINARNIEKEILECSEYDEKIICYRLKLRNLMKILDLGNKQNICSDSDIVHTGHAATQLKRVRLPELDIYKFFGEPDKFLEFWYQFEEAIHNNNSLSPVQKFTYLKSYLGGAAANSISGFSLTEKNYVAAIDLLKQRFGRHDMLVHTHLNNLLNMNTLKSSHDSKGLRNLYDKCIVQIRSLESLNVTSSSYSGLLCPIILKLLPPDLTLEFSRKQDSETEWNIDNLLNFLKHEIESRERAHTIHKSDTVKKPFVNENKFEYRPQGNMRYTSNKINKRDSGFSTELLTSVTDHCVFCNKPDHKSTFCTILTVDKKKDILKKQGRCFLCLKVQHRIKDCRSQERCDICYKKHNRSICYQLENTRDQNANKKPDESVVTISHCDKISTQSESNIFLQTCTAIIRNNETKTKPVRILLDNGSMRTFILRDVSRKLKLPIIRKENLSVYAFAAKRAIERSYNVVKVKLENRDEPSCNIEIEALETDEISAANLPSPDKYIRKSQNKLRGLQLADSYEYHGEKISILIGVDNYYNIVSGKIKRLKNNLVATETIFGWCLQGYTGQSSALFSMKIIVEEREITDQIKKFWELENLGIGPENEDKGILDNDILNDFKSSIKFENNRYKVKFPWKENMKPVLENNRDVALKRFLRLRTTFQNDPSLFSEYKDVIDSYLNENIIEVSNNDNSDNSFYLPHRAVIRDDKLTTRLRIVFDASAHAKGVSSLNDCLHTGLNLTPDIFSLFVKFRMNAIAVTADIQQAFLQIQIDEEDRNFTRFFWDDDPFSEEIGRKFKVFHFNRVLFGLKSSPWLLAATIKEHVERYVNIFPETCNILDSSFFVDDLITSHANISEALEFSTKSFEIFKEASMVLRKWKTNSSDLREKWKSLGLNVDENNYETEFNLNQNSMHSKVLGVVWDANEDLFKFDTKNIEKFLSKKLSTKRYLLQTVGRIFDPIGFLSPYTIRIKCLIQEIWCFGIDWDDNLPTELDVKWNEWLGEIEELNSIEVPRYYLADTASEEIKSIELHSFADASKKAYGAVVYLRALLKNKKVLTSFVASKSRVSPLKTLSIPRLELLAALLAARLSTKIEKNLTFPVRCYFWTDSSITFYWIKGDSDRFKMFVRNRIKEIQSLTDSSNWFHCPGQDNPADLLTRGLRISELRKNTTWWNGPQWLRQNEEFWPKFEKSVDKIDNMEFKEHLDLKKNVIVKSTTVDEKQTENDIISRYSSFSKLIRISSWCLRFIDNIRLEPPARKKGPLDTHELRNATKHLVKVVQSSMFHAEIQCLKKGQSLPNKSRILNLNLFIDQDDLLRVGGRLKFSDIPNDQKHQILLPKNHTFTNLLIDHYHKKFLHTGAQTTLSLIRQHYWIPTGLNQVKKILRKCLVCFRTRVHSQHQIMGNLPRDRITPSKTFEKIGIDLAGPIITKPNIKRSKIKLKSYIAIFICFSTKAVHLEVISDLTAEAFLASLRRFIARRSRPSVIWSDNATNFKATSTILKSFYEICKSDEVQRFSADEGIQWNFIPPASPHFGGLWESNIKSMKRILLRVVNQAVLNFEELTTLLTQIEALLNSRPLSPLSSDPNDLEPLTPGHFLVNGPLLTIPETTNILDSLPLSSRWTQIQKLRQMFWSRWNREYLNELQIRHKWKKASDNIKVDQLVLLKERNTRPQQWPLARIVKVYTGEDKRVRVVDLKTCSGIFRRAISNIVPLPLDDVGQLSNGGRHGPTEIA